MLDITDQRCRSLDQSPFIPVIYTGADFSWAWTRDGMMEAVGNISLGYHFGRNGIVRQHSAGRPISRADPQCQSSTRCTSPFRSSVDLYVMHVTSQGEATHRQQVLLKILPLGHRAKIAPASFLLRSKLRPLLRPTGMAPPNGPPAAPMTAPHLSPPSMTPHQWIRRSSRAGTIKRPRRS